MMKIKTLPVYSKLADDVPPKIKPPDGWQLSQHQVETYNALISGEYDIIFNTAMTGDGKSLAGLLRLLQYRDHVLAMLPTNELIIDQDSKIPIYKDDWKANFKWNTMFGAKITELLTDPNDSRLEVMRRLLDQNQLLLTNPDLFQMMMYFKIGYKWQQKELPFQISFTSDYFIFDEFHIFSAPQIVDVVTIINYLMVEANNPKDRKQFLFLSATPHTLMQNLLARSGVTVKEIKGTYQSSGGEGWRQILHPCELQLAELSQERNMEVWIEENLAEILAFYEQYPGSKGAIIVNSVATAKRVRAWLEANQSKLTIGENTGLTSKTERRASFAKDLLVCTSTVDVGVDFRINLLIFETTSAGTFIQRFGRLGRHAGFGNYRAYILLPKFILERLQKALAEETEIDRESFHEMVQAAYPDEQEFISYASKWGIYQTAHVLAQVQKQLPSGTPFVQTLSEQFDQVFKRQPPKKKFTQLVKRYWAMQNDPEGQQIIKELISFRGQSPLSCGLWDLSDNKLKTYNLFFIIANTEFEVIDKADFMAEVAHRADLHTREFEHQLLYVKVHRYLPHRENFTLGLKKELLAHPEYLHQVKVFKRFYIKESTQPWIGEVNQALKKQPLVCVLSNMSARKLKQKLWLPLLFPIQRLLDRYDDEFSVAFGKEALLLESLLFYRKTEGNQAIIC